MSASLFQQRLLNVLPVGVWHFPEMLARAEQEEMREQVREVVRAAPFTRPQMPGGAEFKLKATNAGDYGWRANGKGFFYSRQQPSGCAWPAIPPQIMDVSRRAAQEAGFTNYRPTNCLINYYEGDGHLGKHRDDTNGEDFTQPVVTISLGATAIFRIGGEHWTDKMASIQLASGDVLVFGAAGRLFYHEVEMILKGTSDLLPNNARLSMTLRRVSFDQPATKGKGH